MSGFQLFPRIIALSEAQDWPTAKLEWIRDYVHWNKEGSHCICGHFIKEECSIRNTLNGNETIVGNCCIRHFQYEVSTAVFKALKDNKVTPSLIKYSHENGIINDWETKFMSSVCRKKRLSVKQRRIYNQMKNKIYKACKMEVEK